MRVYVWEGGGVVNLSWQRRLVLVSRQVSSNSERQGCRPCRQRHVVGTNLPVACHHEALVEHFLQDPQALHIPANGGG